MKQYRKQQRFPDDFGAKNTKDNRTFYTVKKRTSSWYCEGVLVLVVDIFTDIFDFAIQNLAQTIDGKGVDVVVPLQPCNLRWTKAVVVNQLVLGDVLLFHRIPKFIKYYHS